MSELKVTPTGCPGPIPGTKVWRCDGSKCVYNANFASCKEEIIKRGYELRINDDLVQEMQEASKLLSQTVQHKLEELQAVHNATEASLAAKELALVMASDEKAYLVAQCLSTMVEQDKRISELEAQLEELMTHEEQVESVMATIDNDDSNDSNQLDGGSGGELVGMSVEE